MAKARAKRDKGTKTRSTTTVQSVERASRILLWVATSDERVTAKQVADHFGLSLPTAYHLLATLVAEGLLAKERGRRYGLGLKAALIADAVARDTSAPEDYLRILRELAETTGETAYLSAWKGGEITVLAAVEGDQAVRVAGITTGVAGSEHARASGKLLLAFARPEQRDPLLAGRLPKLTPNTITSRKALQRELEAIRREGFAVDREEFALGVTCLSAPIIEGRSVFFAYTISVPTDRYRQCEASLHHAVLSAARKAERST
jgi:IclR family acetate operon transcriptional repressor